MSIRLVWCVLVMSLMATAADVSTFIPGNVSATKIVRDAAGNLYVAVGELTEQGIARAIIVLKLDDSGTRILYRREIGGSGYEYPIDLAVTPDGRAFVLGSTSDKGFETTPGAFQPQAGMVEHAAFLVALNADGSIRYSTLVSSAYAMGPRALAVNDAGEAYVAGKSGSGQFPEKVSLDLPSEQQNHFLLKLNASGSRQIFAVKGVSGRHIALDRDGNVFLAGEAERPEYPTTPGAYQRDFQFAACSQSRAFVFPCTHVVVTKLNAAGTALVYSTFIAGSHEESAAGLAVDDDGYAYVGVNTGSADYPVTPGAVSWDRGGCVTKLNRDGSVLEWSACLGAVTISSVAIEKNRTVLAAGSASDDTSVRTRCQFDPNTGKGYVSRLSADGTTLTGLRILPDPSASVLAGAPAAEGGIVLAGYGTRPELYRNQLDGGLIRAGSRGVVVAGLAPDLPVAARRVTCVRDPADYAYLEKAAPGQLLTFFGGGLGPIDGVQGRLGENGRLSSELAGTRVTFDNEPAPLLYVSDRQVNVAVPFDTAGRDRVRVQVLVDGQIADERALAIVPRDPRLFSRRSAASFVCMVSVANPIEGAVNADGAMNSCDRPASRGSVVAIFLHGLGLTGSQFPDGTINPVPPPTLSLPVEVSNPNISVDFAGAAALQVTGVWQINLRLPSAGAAFEAFRLTVGGTQLGQDPFIIRIR